MDVSWSLVRAVYRYYLVVFCFTVMFDFLHIHLQPQLELLVQKAFQWFHIILALRRYPLGEGVPRSRVVC